MAEVRRLAVGTPCWVEVMSSDVAGAERFYSELLGWTVERGAAQTGGYRELLREGVPVAGLMGNHEGDDEADAWSVYLHVADAAATTAAVREHGGHVVVEPLEVHGRGTMAFVIDPAGVPVGLWQPASFAGFGLVEEPGSPDWFELSTNDYSTTLEFHRSVFGWRLESVSDSEDFRYATAMDGDTAVAGVLDVGGRGSPTCPGWEVYFVVSDCERACGRVEALGGRVEQGPDASPYGLLASVSDPTGARFKLHQRV